MRCVMGGEDARCVWGVRMNGANGPWGWAVWMGCGWGVEGGVEGGVDGRCDVRR